MTSNDKFMVVKMTSRQMYKKSISYVIFVLSLKEVFWRSVHSDEVSSLYIDLDTTILPL